nr:MAG: hypothetical protein H1RhizoLitter39194_000002 [Mitovirus sp.]
MRRHAGYHAGMGWPGNGGPDAGDAFGDLRAGKQPAQSGNPEAQSVAVAQIAPVQAVDRNHDVEVVDSGPSRGQCAKSAGNDLDMHAARDQQGFRAQPVDSSRGDPAARRYVRPDPTPPYQSGLLLMCGTFIWRNDKSKSSSRIMGI